VFEVSVKLSDLPQFAIEGVEDADTNPRLVGRLSQLKGVREGSSWLYAGDESVIGELEQLDVASGSAVFSAPFWTADSPARPGTSLPWLDAYWQAYHVTMILDPANVWRREEFVASDAQYFEVDGHIGWQKIGQEFPEGAVPRQVARGGWDHEHCEICAAHIGTRGARAGYVDTMERWLCEACYNRYAQPRDLSFLAAT